MVFALQNRDYMVWYWFYCRKHYIMKQKKQLEILNYATKKALKDVDKQRGESPPDFIKEFYKWCSLVKKYIKERLN